MIVREKMLALHGPTSFHWANSKGGFSGKQVCKTNAIFLAPPGTTALHLAVKERNLDLVQELLELEVDPSPRMRMDGWTPLHTAANRRQNLEMIQLLVQYRADVNAVYVLHPKIVLLYLHRGITSGPSRQSFYLSGLLVLAGPLFTGQ